MMNMDKIRTKYKQPQRHKRLLSVVMSIILFISAFLAAVPLTEKTVYAQDTIKKIEFGYELLGVGADTENSATVYYGNDTEKDNDTEIYWKVIGYDGTGVAASTNTGSATLWVPYDITESKFNEIGANNWYASSTLQYTVNSIYENKLNDCEKNCIVPRTLQIDGYTDTVPYSDGVAGAPVPSAYLWPLSSQEAYYNNYNTGDYDEHYWLRSPGYSEHGTPCAANVFLSGKVDPFGIHVTGNLGVRPAFNLDLSSIMLTSPAVGGKDPGTGGVGTLNEVTDYTGGNEWKLTLHDTTRDGPGKFTAQAKSGAILSQTEGYTSWTVPVVYSGAVTGENEHVSAILTDNAGTALYYGYITTSEGEASTIGVNVTIPTGLDAGTYTLKVFNEQVNGDKMTDLSSAMHDITLTVRGRVATPTFTPVAGTYNGEQSVTIYCATDGAAIYYTTDGSAPTTGSTEYTGAISVPATTTIKAIAVKDGMPDSNVAEATYTITSAPIYAVTVNNGTGDGNYAEGANVTIAADPPESGKRFKEWTGADGLIFTSGSATSSPATFTMPANEVTLTATYEDEQYTLEKIEIGHEVLGTGITDDNPPIVYYGRDADGFYWRVVGYDGSYTAASTNTGKVTLLPNHIMGQTEFNKTGMSNAYTSSTLQSAVNSIYENQFYDYEKNSIIPRTLRTGSFISEAPYTDGISGSVVLSAYLWPLSAKEQYYLPNHKMIYEWYWLRSPGSDNSYAAVSNAYGEVVPGGELVNSTRGVRPAFNLDLSSILFISAAAGGKNPGTGGVGTLNEVTDYTGGTEWKLTLHDTSRDGSGKFTAAAKSGAALWQNEGYTSWTVPVVYSGAVTGENEHVSAILTDNAGTALYYGYIANDSASSTDGVNVTVPMGLDEGTYKLRVFNEQVHGDGMTDLSSAMHDITLTVGGKVATPAFSPAEGTYTEEQRVTISCATSGAQIYYTTDGSVPTTRSTEYTGVISVPTTMTIKAIAVKDGKHDSDIAEATYTISPAPTKYAVTVNNGTGDGNYAEGANVTIAADPPESGKRFKEWTGADDLIFTDGSATTSPATFTMPANEVTLTATYEDLEVVAAPVFDPAGGTYASAQTVTITCATSGAQIYYTTDGSAPSAESTEYTEAIPVPATATIKAVAVKDGMADSAVSEATYTIGNGPVITKAPAAKADLVYNGQPQELITAGEAAGGTFSYALGSGTEASQAFTASIPTATDAGTYYVWYQVSSGDNEPAAITSRTDAITIGKADYDGQKETAPYVICEEDMDAVSVRLPSLPEGAAYTVDSVEDAGGLINGEVSVNGTVLTFATKATAGGTTATVTLLVKNAKNYKDYSVTATISSKAGMMWIEDIPDQDYTGSAIKPDITVRFKDKILSEKDYTVAYKNNTNAAASDAVNPKTGASTAPTVTVKGKGNFAGTASETFTIKPLDIEGADAPDMIFAHDGKKAQYGKTKVTYVLNGKTVTLKENKDFTYEFEKGRDYKEAGTYATKITGCGNFCGQKTYTQTIAGADQTLLAKVTVPKIPDQTYTGKKFILKTKDGQTAENADETFAVSKKGNAQEDFRFVLKNGRDELKEGDDYTLSYSDNKDAGTATVTIRAAGGENSRYAGSRTVTFKIKGTALSSYRMENMQDFEWDGTEKKQADQMFYYLTGSGKDAEKHYLARGTGYTETYSDNVDAGTATVIYTGINGNTGTVKKTFRITARSADAGGITIKRPDDGLVWKAVMTDPSDAPAYDFVKGGVRPEPAVVYSAEGREPETLVKDKDYTLAYSNNTKPGLYSSMSGTRSSAPTVTVKFMGRFSGSASRAFSINAGGLGALTATDVPAQDKKTGLYRKTVITLTDTGGMLLKSGTDFYPVTDKTKTAFRYAYFGSDPEKKSGTVTVKAGAAWNAQTVNSGDEVTDAHCIPAGTAIEVTVTGKGCYEGKTMSGTFLFGAEDFSKASVTIPDRIYKGSAYTADDLKDCITVTLKAAGGNKVLAYGTDYEIKAGSIENSVNAGTAKLVLAGKPGAGYAGEKSAAFKIVSKQMNYTIRYEPGFGDPENGLVKQLIEKNPDNITGTDEEKSAHYSAQYRITPDVMKDSVIPAGEKLPANKFKVQKKSGKNWADAGIAFAGWKDDKGHEFADKAPFKPSWLARLLYGETYTLHAQWYVK